MLWVIEQRRLTTVLPPPFKTDMSFAIECSQGRWRHAADPMLYLRWLWQNPRQVATFVAAKYAFHKAARAELARAANDDAHGRPWPQITLSDWMHDNKLDPLFADGWLKPFCAAVWSSDQEELEAMDVRALLKFLENHG